MKKKTRIAYGKGSNGDVYKLCDTVDEALKANMLYKDYEVELAKINPQLEIFIKIEEV